MLLTASGYRIFCLPARMKTDIANLPTCQRVKLFLLADLRLLLPPSSKLTERSPPPTDTTTTSNLTPQTSHFKPHTSNLSLYEKSPLQQGTNRDTGSRSEVRPLTAIISHYLFLASFHDAMSQYGYTIRRITSPGEPIDLCAPLEFFPPKGSDELHEALKLAFPFEPTLQARMRQAVINFHLCEAQADIVQSDFVQEEYLPSPESSFVDNATSPSMAFPLRQRRSTSRHSSDPPAQEELMDVWCLPSQPPAKIHTRRNMTAEEKRAYKAKRLAGACADCKRRRRKCHHDPSDPTGAIFKNVVKTRKRSSVAKRPATESCATPSSSFAVTPAMAVQDSLTFAPQDSLFSFESDLNSPMANDMSFTLGFENGFGNNVEFDLRNDFDLFPDNTGFSSAGMDATSWLAGSSPDSPLLDNQLETFSRGPNGWPMDPLQADNAAGVPLTPQSLSPQSLMMSRSQSEHSSSSSSLCSIFGGNNVIGPNHPVFNQEAGNFLMHSPQSILASPNAGSRSSQRTSAGPAILRQLFVPTWSPQDLLHTPTTSFQSRTSRGSTLSSERWPSASWVGTGLLNHDSTDHVSASANILECSDQRPVIATSSSNGPSSSSSSSRTTAASSHQPSSASSDQDERAHRKSIDSGRILSTHLGAADGNASRRLTTRMISRATASAPEHQSRAQFVRSSDSAREGVEDAGWHASTINLSKGIFTRMNARPAHPEHLISGVQFVQSPDLTGQAGRVENADRAVSAPDELRRRSTRIALEAILSEHELQFGLRFGGTSVCSQLIDNNNSESIAWGIVASRQKAAKTTSSGHSSSANVQNVLPSDLINQTGYLETSDRPFGMSKLCRLKHSSAAADEVCCALQSSFDLPSLDGLASNSIISGANIFQWITLALFTAIHLFGISSSLFSDLAKNAKTKQFLEHVIDSDGSKERKDISTRATSHDIGAWQKKSQPHNRYSHRALGQQSSPWQLFSGSMRQTISWLREKAGKMQFKARRIC